MTLPGTRTARSTGTGPLVNASTVGGNASHLIAATGVSQVLINEAADRAYFFFQNLSLNAMWVNFGAVATAATPSIKVPAGAILEFGEGDFCPGDAAAVLGTINDTYCCKVG